VDVTEPGGREDEPKPSRFGAHVRRGSTWLLVTVAAAAVATLVGYFIQSRLTKDSASPHSSVSASAPPPHTAATTPTHRDAPKSKPNHQPKTTAPPQHTEAAPPPALEVQVTNRSAGPWVIPRALSALPAPPTSGGTSCPTADWVKTLAGANAHEMQFYMYVTGISDRPVIVDRARVAMAGTGPPLHGRTVACGEGEGGPLSVRTLEARLGRHKHTLNYVPGPDPRHPDSSKAKQLDFRFVFGKDHVEAFQVHALAQGCDCRWTLQLSYLANGRRRTYEVTDGGIPFHISSTERAPNADFSAGHWRAP
jgi:hypothetical protein